MKAALMKMAKRKCGSVNENNAAYIVMVKWHRRNGYECGVKAAAAKSVWHLKSGAAESYLAAKAGENT